MLARAASALLILAAATAPLSATADEAVVLRVKPTKACTAKAATPADLGEVAYAPDAFAGRCVSLQGYWRDVAVYPTRAEAAQPDALSIPFLDRRRVGLYASAKDEARAPAAPAAVHVVGVVGSCATLLAGGADVTGYCHDKAGAYLAVSGISLDK
ncbi:hypothetical protein [Phenylobacterium sp.]|uniref:hypothetical protein n=1 Tax=Phenylobacterium sp. TaxID=1871053 RepID=UPI0025E088AF|nr:hypothetical protein [Phenylobacterium sp.]MBX3483499.1 hypothetical protein [Phenylobacterium sp.]MCW5761095.1 hypothetical protein [Phenylobacterium sp.]